MAKLVETQNILAKNLGGFSNDKRRVDGLFNRNRTTTPVDSDSNKSDRPTIVTLGTSFT